MPSKYGPKAQYFGLCYRVGLSDCDNVYIESILRNFFFPTRFTIPESDNSPRSYGQNGPKSTLSPDRGTLKRVTTSPYTQIWHTQLIEYPHPRVSPGRGTLERVTMSPYTHIGGPKTPAREKILPYLQKVSNQGYSETRNTIPNRYINRSYSVVINTPLAR